MQVGVQSFDQGIAFERTPVCAQPIIAEGAGSFCQEPDVVYDQPPG